MSKRKQKRKLSKVACGVCGHMKLKGKPCRSRICLGMRTLDPVTKRKWRIVTVPPTLALVLAHALRDQYQDDEHAQELSKLIPLGEVVTLQTQGVQ